MLKTNNNGKKKHYIIYTRCSTDEQAMGDFTTLDAQAHHCKNMLDAFGHEFSEFGNKGIINDDGYSAKDLNRPGIKKILESINSNKREFDGIIFFRLDRLTRNPRDLYAMIDLFNEHDVDFVSVRENLDSSTAIGRVVIGILGLLSAFERELTGERVKAAFIARARQGMRTGGKAPIGYKIIPDGPPLPNGKQPTRIILDETMAPHIKVIWEMAANNKSQAEIAHELMSRKVFTANKIPWRRQGIAHIIKNPFYKGYIHYSGETHRGKHQPLVEEKMWEKANKLMSAKTPGRRFWKNKDGYEHLLSGLMKCGKCNSSLVGVGYKGHTGKKFYYYECGRSRQGLGCSYKRISAPDFDKAILSYFKRASDDQEVITRAIGTAIHESEIKFEKVEEKLHEKRIRFNTLRHEVENLLNLAAKNSIPQGLTFKNKLTSMENEIQTLDDEIKNLEKERKTAQISAHSGQHVHENIKTALKHLDGVPPAVQKNLLRALIQNIIVYEDKIIMNVYLEQEKLSGFLANVKNLTPITDQGEAKSPKPTSVASTDPVLTWGQTRGG
ncbi:MAG: recombinase family protein [Candidatus Omnitrophota bacterium]